MKCDLCKNDVNYVKYIRGYALCRNCLLTILFDFGTYLGKGKFEVRKFIIKWNKHTNKNSKNTIGMMSGVDSYYGYERKNQKEV